MMVALAVSMLLLGGLIQVYLSSKQSYNAQERLARMQESGRFAMDLIVRDLRRAGYWGGNADVAANGGLPGPAAELYGRAACTISQTAPAIASPCTERSAGADSAAAGMAAFVADGSEAHTVFARSADRRHSDRRGFQLGFDQRLGLTRTPPAQMFSVSNLDGLTANVEIDQRGGLPGDHQAIKAGAFEFQSEMAR